ncbi:MAG: DNA repair protein RecO [Bacteroidales bacterium]|nr:DNA repair protein RecO [Bacteroidales bacterium]
MIVNTKCVVLSRINYSEADLIVRLYTEKLGMISAIIKGARKKSTTKAVLFQPLTLLEIVLDYKEKKELQFLKETNISYNLHDLHTDIYKTSLGFFIAELTHKCITQIEADESLYDFIEKSILSLDRMPSSVADFHLFFMIKLLGILGFDISNQLNNSLFIDKKMDSHLMNKVLMMLTTFYYADELPEIRSDYNVRQAALTTMLDYFYTHVEGMKPLKTVDILTTVLHA